MKKGSNSNYLDFYDAKIAPCLERIDVLVKERKFPVAVKTAARACGISDGEAFETLNDIGAEVVDEQAFFQLVSRASSHACRMLRREVEIGSPAIYEPSQIAYIYGLDANTVRKACKDTIGDRLTGRDLPRVFEKIAI